MINQNSDSVSDILQSILGTGDKNIYRVMSKINQGKFDYQDTPTLIEVVTTHHLVQAGSDRHRLNKKYLSEPNQATEFLSFKEITIAGIGMSRNDIPSKQELSNKHRDTANIRTFTMRENKGFCGIQLNNDASSENRYNQDLWQSERLGLINEALKLGANIISLGEFDFPPEYDGDKKSQNKTKEFEDNIFKAINSVTHPVFLVAGSRHEYDGKRKVTGLSNVARIYVNDILFTIRNKSQTTNPVIHSKRVGAQKIGEKLTMPDGIDLNYYSTDIGKIGVLICVDAYDPNIVFEFFRKCDLSDGDKVDYIIIPSYNSSPKLHMVCQTLSLLTKTVVLLVDSCCVNNEIDSNGVSLFINGSKFRGLKKKNKGIGRRRNKTSENLSVWTLNLNEIIEEINGSGDATPFYSEVQALVKSSTRGRF